MTAPPRLRSNLAYLVLGDAAGKVINVLAFMRLGRVLEKDGYGRLEFVVAVAAVGALVIEAGLGPFGARAVARDRLMAGRMVGRVVALRSILLVGAWLMIGVVAALVAAGDAGQASLVATAAFMLLPRPLLAEWLFQGRGEMRTVVATMLIEPLVVLGGTMLLVHGPADVARVPFILGVAVAATAATQQVIARMRGVRGAWRAGMEDAGATLRAALPLGLGSLFWALRFYAPIIAFGLFAPGAPAGAFAAAHRIAVSLHAVVWLYFFNLLPHWSRLHAAGGGLDADVRRSWMRSLALAGGLVAAVLVFADLLTLPLLYGEAYAPSVDLLRFLAVVPALAWLSGNFRFGLIARDAAGRDMLANAAGAAVAVVAFLVLGHRITPWAAAVTFAASEAVTLLAAAAFWRARATRS